MKKRGAFALFGMFLLFVAITGCSSNTTVSNNVSSNSAEKKEPASSRMINYGGSSWSAHMPAYIAVKKGFFEQQGLHVEFKSFPTSSARMTALASGDLDFGSTGSISAISLMASGDKNFKVIGIPVTHSGGQEGVIASKDIKSIVDLKGKKIGVPYSSSSHVMLVDLFKQAGIDPQKDVQLINMSGDDAVSAFTTGQIAAAANWPPTYQKLLTLEGAHVIAMDKDMSLFKNYKFTAGPDLLVMSKKFINENPTTVKKLLTGYVNALNWMQNNPEEAAKIFTELTNVDVKQQMDILKPLQWLTNAEDQKKLLATDGDLTKTLNSLSQFLSENKLINNQVDVKEWIDTNVLP